MEPRNVFITGASSGFGAALAARYASANATLGLVARRAHLVHSLARALEAEGARVLEYVGDVGDTDFMQGAAHDFVATASGIDLVVANAGIGRPDGASRTDPHAVARLLRTNVVGVTNTVLPFVGAMVERGRGTLVAIGSVAGYRALPGSTAYCASKAAVHAYMDGLRMDLHGTGVHAMTICPGFVKTPMTDHRRHPMPFIMDLEKAVDLMVAAIAAKKDTYCFPWQMRALRHAARHVPERLLRRLAPKRS